MSDSTLALSSVPLVGVAVRGSLRNSDLKIADAFVHIEPYLQIADARASIR
ncbi:MAG: hypothetical protein ACKO3V_17965 [Pirellula sp.]